MILAHRIALDPTTTQERYFRQAAGTARFTWNAALAEWNRRYLAGEKPNAALLRREWNKRKYQDYPWLAKIHRDSHSQPFANLKAAFTKFFRGEAKHPTFKKRGQHDSFYVANDRLKLNGKRARLPVIGWVRLREALRFSGKIMSATVSREADRWFISVQVDMPNAKRKRAGDAVAGVDVGLTTMATISTVDGDGVLANEKRPGPKALKTLLPKLVRLSRSVSRKVKGSANRSKAVMRLARLHRRIKNVRNDFLHKLTSHLCRENQAVVIEDLNVSGILANRSLARSVSDAGFHEMKRQLGYKGALYGTRIILADRWYPSTQTCSGCGAINKTPLGQRVYRCQSCGLVMDRDENASNNLVALGLRVIACGDGSAGVVDSTPCETAVSEAGTAHRGCSRALTL